LVVTRLQYLGHSPAAIRRGAGVVRVLGGAAERLAERLLDRALGVAERAGELADDRGGDDQRRQLAAGDDEPADRDRVRDQVLAHAVVDALVAPAQNSPPP